MAYYEDVNLDRIEKAGCSRSCFISRSFDNTYERPQEIDLVEWLFDNDDGNEKVGAIPAGGSTLKLYCNRFCKQYVNTDNCCSTTEWEQLLAQQNDKTK